MSKYMMEKWESRKSRQVHVLWEEANVGSLLATQALADVKDQGQPMAKSESVVLPQLLSVL